jgi:hypothetical protein
LNEGELAYHRHYAISTKTDKGQEYQTEPSEIHESQWDSTSVLLNVLLPDVPFLAHMVKGIYKELGGDGQ